MINSSPASAMEFPDLHCSYLSSQVCCTNPVKHPPLNRLFGVRTRRPGENIVVSPSQKYSGDPNHHDSPPPALMPSPACPVTPPFPPQLLRNDRGTGPSPCGQPGAVSERCARLFSVSCYFYGFVFGYAIPPLLSPPTPPPSFLGPFVHGFQGHWPGQLQGQWPVNGGGNVVFIA